MKTFATALLISAMTVAMPVFAADNADDNAQDVRQDKAAIAKDNAALRKDERKLHHHRAAKAHAKANRQYGEQAKESVAIGAEHTKIAEKRAERKADEKILHHDRREMSEDNDRYNERYSDRMDRDYDYRPSSGNRGRTFTNSSYSNNEYGYYANNNPATSDYLVPDHVAQVTGGRRY